MLKLLYVPTLNIPVCYWRIENYAQKMVDMGNVKVNVEYFQDLLDINMAWDDACVGKGELSRDIQKKLRNAFKFFDIIIFQRIQNMPALALIEKLREEYPKVKLVAELDDSVGDVPPSSPYKWKEHHKWSAEHLYRSDAVVCSTQYLADSIKFIVKDKPIHIAPNCINNKTWKFKKPKNRIENEIRFGYVGGGAHDEDLLIVYRAILPLFELYPGLKLVVRYGGWKPQWLKDHPQIDFQCVGWSIDEYPQKISDMNIDVGLAPLRDSEFNRCKSNLKWLEWASMNIPLIASNVEPYRNTGEYGGIRLVDNTTAEWNDALYGTIETIKKGVVLKDHPDFIIKRKSLRKQQATSHNITLETNKLLKFLEGLL